jgi:hypothetical protein
LISSKIWASQAKNRQAKPSARGVVKRPMSHGEWKDLGCFDRGARMDSLAVVLTTLSRSSMYEIVC